MSDTQTKRATIETAYGQTLAVPVKFSYSYDELGKDDEIPADEIPSAEDLKSYVNQKRAAKARAGAQAEALKAAGIEKPTLEDPKVRLAGMIKILKAAGNSDSQAEQMARQMLGM